MRMWLSQRVHVVTATHIVNNACMWLSQHVHVVTAMVTITDT